MKLEGWLLDLYPSEKGMVVWLKTPDGRALKFIDDYHPTLYVHASPGDLKELEAELQTSESVRRISHVKKRVRLRELKALVKEIDQVIYRMEHGLRPREIRDGLTRYAFAYAFGSTPSEIYEHDSRAQNVERWQELKENIKKAMKKKANPSRTFRRVR